MAAVDDVLKALSLQSGYGLSDPGLGKQLSRDLMFRRSLNLGLGEGVPGEANRQLSAKGLYLKADEASIVEAKQSRPRKVKDSGNTQGVETGYRAKAAANCKKTGACQRG